MNPNSEETPAIDALTAAERVKLIAIVAGFALVLAFVFHLSVRFKYYDLFVKEIEEAVRDGRINSLRGFIALFLFYAVGLPGGVIVCLSAFLQNGT